MHERQSAHRQTSSESTVHVTGYERNVISAPDKSGITLVSTLLHERFEGGLNGTGVAEHVRVVRPDGTDTFTGIERFTGTLEDRTGSFALVAEGRTTDGVVHGTWRVVEGSATEDLTGLRGFGAFTAETHPPRPDDTTYGTATDCFTYWFEDAASPE